MRNFCTRLGTRATCMGFVSLEDSWARYFGVAGVLSLGCLALRSHVQRIELFAVAPARNRRRVTEAVMALLSMALAGILSRDPTYI